MQTAFDKHQSPTQFVRQLLVKVQYSERKHVCKDTMQAEATAKARIKDIVALIYLYACTLLGIKWHQFVCNEEVRRITKQPNLTTIIQSRRLSIFGMQMPR